MTRIAGLLCEARGGCSGTGTCTVNGSGGTSVTATFTSTANSGDEPGVRVALD